MQPDVENKRAVLGGLRVGFHTAGAEAPASAGQARGWTDPLVDRIRQETCGLSRVKDSRRSRGRSLMSTSVAAGQVSRTLVIDSGRCRSTAQAS